MTEEKTVVLSETELDGLNQGKNVINIFVDLSKRGYNKSHIKKLVLVGGLLAAILYDWKMLFHMAIRHTPTNQQ